MRRACAALDGDPAVLRRGIGGMNERGERLAGWPAWKKRHSGEGEGEGEGRGEGEGEGECKERVGARVRVRARQGEWGTRVYVEQARHADRDCAAGSDVQACGPGRCWDTPPTADQVSRRGIAIDEWAAAVVAARSATSRTQKDFGADRVADDSADWLGVCTV
jgi:hypothetical protein